MDLAEHELVQNQLKPLDGGRRAYRLVGGVLMERTVGEVLPELTDTAGKVSPSHQSESGDEGNGLGF